MEADQLFYLNNLHCFDRNANVLFSLGEGQFGEVYNGKWIGNRNNGVTRQSLLDVAIKCLRCGRNSVSADLIKEGQRMLELDHPNIVKMFGICKRTADVSLILELCPHGAMNSWLKNNR